MSKLYDPNGPVAARQRRKQAHIPIWEATAVCPACGTGEDDPKWLSVGIREWIENGLACHVTPYLWPLNLNWLVGEHNQIHEGHRAKVVVYDAA